MRYSRKNDADTLGGGLRRVHDIISLCRRMTRATTFSGNDSVMPDVMLTPGSVSMRQNMASECGCGEDELRSASVTWTVRSASMSMSSAVPVSSSRSPTENSDALDSASAFSSSSWTSLAPPTFSMYDSRMDLSSPVFRSCSIESMTAGISTSSTRSWPSSTAMSSILAARAIVSGVSETRMSLRLILARSVLYALYVRGCIGGPSNP